MSQTFTIKPLESRNPDLSTAQAHHVGNPPSSFKNPWPSFQGISLTTVFKLRFGNDPEKNFVPVPQGPNGSRSDELVKVQKPDWAADKPDRLRATWIGHASFLVETPAAAGAERGIRILFDPLFSERTSPFSFMGPKRYTPTPCSLDELPEVDIVCISHNHYDHLDHDTVLSLYKRGQGRIHFFVGLNDKAWFEKHICLPEDVTEMDWWDSCEVEVEGIGSVQLTCTPSQHASNRSGYDAGRALWCSWSLRTSDDKRLFFAGDTGYQHQDAPSPCPIFTQIGKTLGPFDLALIPIGLFKPQKTSGGVHCSPEQALLIHQDIDSRLSIGMHYGTVRGGLSSQFEDVREPPRRFREAAEKLSLWRGGGVEGNGKFTPSGDGGVGLCDVGETVTV